MLEAESMWARLWGSGLVEISDSQRAVQIMQRQQKRKPARARRPTTASQPPCERGAYDKKRQYVRIEASEYRLERRAKPPLQI